MSFAVPVMVRTTSLLVLHKGRLIHESYYEGYDAQSKATSFSVAKTFVSTLIGIALAEGAIASLDDPVVGYRPDLAASGFAGATLRDLLQMSSGIAFSEVYDDPTTDAFTIYDRMYAEFADIDQVAASFGSAQPAGATFHYASINTHALAMVLEAATGKSLAVYLHEKLWEPLGAVSDASWITDVRGGEVGFWGFNARPRDFARLGQLYLQYGVWDGAQLITREWVESSTRAERDDPQRGRIAGDWGYQHHWWLPRGEYDDFSAIGIWGQFIYVNRDLDLVVVKTSADPDFKAHEFEAIEYFRRIGEHLAGEERAPRAPKLHVQKVRIDKAKKLLLATGLSVKAIAYEVGYENVSFFVRLFRTQVADTRAVAQVRSGGRVLGAAQLRGCRSAGFTRKAIALVWGLVALC